MQSVEVGSVSSGAANHRNWLGFVDARVHVDLTNVVTWLVVRVIRGATMVVTGSGRLKGGS